MSQSSSPDNPVSAAPGPADFAHRLVRWQLQHGRHDLPWQGRDPYRVWLSEIMLQQTQVAVVAQYFPRFVSRFPTVHALAAAGQDAVLAAWSGLGYYQRARNLHRCAQIVVERHGGQLPRTAAQLARLPGIGPSTAAAIAAFCHHERAAILDGNVQRVLCRSHGISDPVPSAAATRRLHALAAALLPEAEHMPAYTQGLMDLGATVCRPRQPRCGLCPFHTDCRARLTGQEQRLPVRLARTARPQRSAVMLWLRSAADDSVWLEKRPPQGVWPGLWSLPQFDSSAQAAAYAAQFGRVLRQTVLPGFRHVFTHFELCVQPVRIDLHAMQQAAELPGQWFAARNLDEIALPAPVRRLLLDPGENS